MASVNERAILPRSVTVGRTGRLNPAYDPLSFFRPLPDGLDQRGEVVYPTAPGGGWDLVIEPETFSGLASCGSPRLGARSKGGGVALARVRESVGLG